MIGLVFAMLVARHRQALAVLLLSVFATGAAVAGPVYLNAVHHAVAVTEVAESDRLEQTVALSTSVGGETGLGVDRFDALAPHMLTLPGFAQIYSAQFPVLGVERGVADTSSLVFRADVCPHLRLLAGRCPMSAHDIVVGEQTARRTRLAPGATVTVQAARYDESTDRFVPDGAPALLTVVGVYRPLDRTEMYWGRSGFFADGKPQVGGEPIFANRQTVDGIDHRQDYRRVEAVPAPGALTADRLPALRAALDELRSDVGDRSGGVSFIELTLEITALLDRIDRGRELARQLVPVAAVPLVALCWFVIFLVVAYGSSARQHELGLVALRGVGRPLRWWLTAAESTLVVLLGAPLGYLTGTVAVRLVVQGRFGSPAGTELGPAALPYALAAATGAVLASVLAHRAQLARPVLDLLRRVPARHAAWRSTAVEVTVVVLAVVAVVQLRGFEGELVGLALLVPALVAVAIALLAARLLMPLAARLGARQLRRGRLGPALGALALARRPGSHRLFVLLTVAVALLGFAAAAVDVATRARSDRATVRAGAQRVLTVLPVDAGTLLRAVRDVDPAGRYAMAAAVIPAPDGDRSSVLAVDTTRLARVATWRPQFGPGPTEVAERLRPPTPEPFVLRGTRLALTLDNAAQSAGGELTITVVLRPLAGGAPVRVSFAAIGAGRGAYVGPAGPCADGCRVAGIAAVYDRPGSFTAEVLIRELADADSGAVVVSPADFADPRRWRGSADGVLQPGRGGLRVDVPGTTLRPETWVLPADVPRPMPVVPAGPLPESGQLPGLDAERRPVTPVARVTTLPRLGGRGVLTDLEYAERAAVGGTLLEQPQVWLGRGAPADAASRLAGQGLVVVEDRTVAEERRLLDRSAPALAIWFHLLAAAFAVALAVGGLLLVAAVDRRRRVEDLRALRRQGLPAGAVGRTALWSCLPVVLAALAIGGAAAGAAWWMGGPYLPLFVDDAVVLAPPRWPAPLAVLWPGALAGAVFAAAAVTVALALRHAVTAVASGKRP